MFLWLHNIFWYFFKVHKTPLRVCVCGTYTKIKLTQKISFHVINVCTYPFILFIQVDFSRHQHALLYFFTLLCSFLIFRFFYFDFSLFLLLLKYMLFKVLHPKFRNTFFSFFFLVRSSIFTCNWIISPLLEILPILYNSNSIHTCFHFLSSFVAVIANNLYRA